MKIRFEQTTNKDLEIIVKGDINDNSTVQILSVLNNISDFGKIIVLNENESFVYDVSEIVFFETESGKIYAQTLDDRYEVKEKLYELVERFSNKGFIQINKGTIVNIDYVKSISAEFSGNYSLKLKKTNKTLTISRKYFSSFKNFIRR